MYWGESSSSSPRQKSSRVLVISVHSSNLFPVNRSYISTMNRLALSGKGAVGPGAHPELGVGQDVAVGPLHLQDFVAVGVGLAGVPGPLHQLVGVHVVDGGQLADHVAARHSLAPLDLGEVRAGDAGALVHVPEAEVSA